MWSPYEIEVMLHHYASSSPFPRAGARVYPECTEKLIAKGLLESCDGGLQATELGQAFIRMLCETPVPVAEYRDPRFSESKGDERGNFSEGLARAWATHLRSLSV